MRGFCYVPVWSVLLCKGNMGTRSKVMAPLAGLRSSLLFEPSPVTTPESGVLGRYANAYAARAFPVFPCVPRMKRPATTHGLYAATCDDTARIERWWGKVPHANIGIACGQSLVVLDVDVKHDAPGLRSFLYLLANQRWNLTLLCHAARAIVFTPSGGFHLWFDEKPHTAPPSRKPLPGYPGIEVKSTGTYIVAPPSVIRMDDGSLGHYRFGTTAELAELIGNAHG